MTTSTLRSPCPRRPSRHRHRRRRRRPRPRRTHGHSRRRHRNRPRPQDGTQPTAITAAAIRRTAPQPDRTPCPHHRRRDSRTVARRAPRWRPARHRPPRPPTGMRDATRRCPACSRGLQPPPGGALLPRTGPGRAGEGPRPPTRPTTPAPRTLAPLAGNEPCPHLTTYHDTLRQRCHEFLLGWHRRPRPLPRSTACGGRYALLEAIGRQHGPDNRDVHAHRARIPDGPPTRAPMGRATQCDEPRVAPATSVRPRSPHGDGAGRRRLDCRPGRRQCVAPDPKTAESSTSTTCAATSTDGGTVTDLDWYLSEYELLEPIWPAGTPLVEAYARTI